MSHFLLTVEVTSLVQPLTMHILIRSSFEGGSDRAEAAPGPPSHLDPLLLPSFEPPLSLSFLLVLAPRSMNLRNG